MKVKIWARRLTSIHFQVGEPYLVLTEHPKGTINIDTHGFSVMYAGEVLDAVRDALVAGLDEQGT